MKLKLNFQEPEAINVWYGLDTSTIHFFIWIYGEEKLEEFMADLMLLLPIFNSRMSPFKIFKHQFHKMTKHTQRIRR